MTPLFMPLQNPIQNLKQKHGIYPSLREGIRYGEIACPPAYAGASTPPERQGHKGADL